MKSNGSNILVVCAVVIIGVIALVKAGSVGMAKDTPIPAEHPAAEGNIEGSVSNVIDVPGYTYVEVETADGIVWVAAPSVPVQVGEPVSFSTGMPMQDFYSKTLEREFEVLYFVDRFISSEGTASIDSDAAAAHGRVANQATAPTVEKVEKAEGGYTIADIYSRGDDLRGEPMRVRGQVVKFTVGVMNTNWIRIKDGSTADDLVIPTDATVAVNDIVLVEGRLELNKDLGQGYVIPAILEDAEITVE